MYGEGRGSIGPPLTSALDGGEETISRLTAISPENYLSLPLPPAVPIL
jgi:hypothetical protein